MPFPVPDIQVDGGSEFAAEIEPARLFPPDGVGQTLGSAMRGSWGSWDADLKGLRQPLIWGDEGKEALESENTDPLMSGPGFSRAAKSSVRKAALAAEVMAPPKRRTWQRGLRWFVLPPRSPQLNGRVERAQRTHTEQFYEVIPDSFQLPALTKLSATLPLIISSRPVQQTGPQYDPLPSRQSVTNLLDEYASCDFAQE